MLVHLVILFHDDDFELLADGLSDLLEAKCHGLVLIRADVLVELLVNLVDDASAPRFDLLVYQLDLPVYCLVLALLTGLLRDLDIQLVQVRVLGLAASLDFHSAAVFDLQIVKLNAPLVVRSPKSVDLVFVVSDLAQQLCISLFSGEEPVDDILDVGQASGCSDCLESLFDVRRAFHLLFHLAF